jgi:tetratricopeptide (TPR) repeat protein
MNLLDEALAEFSQAAKLQPDFASSYYHLGLVYERKGLREKAVEQFELFLKYSSDEAQKEKVRGWLLKLRSQNP